MTDSAAASRSTQPDVATLQWLALMLTPATGPIRGHRIVQQFGGVERVFSASLTELEASGLPAAAAQSIALGKSFSLAEEEFMRARDANAEQFLQKLHDILSSEETRTAVQALIAQSQG